MQGTLRVQVHLLQYKFSWCRAKMQGLYYLHVTTEMLVDVKYRTDIEGNHIDIGLFYLVSVPEMEILKYRYNLLKAKQRYAARKFEKYKWIQYI
jgi:hypothetical protein